MPESNPLHDSTSKPAVEMASEPQLLQAPSLRRYMPLTVACAIILIGFALSILGVKHELNTAQALDQQRFDRLSEQLRGELVRRVLVYNYGLKGARGLFPASNSVERHEFRAMVESRDLPNDFPGAIGIGYIHRVEDSPESVSAFVEATRAEDAPEFAITVPPGAAPLPGAATDDRYIIEFIEPVENNRPAQGLDIGSHPVRREATERAMLTGEGSITGRIDLVQDDQKFAGFLYLLPVFTKGMPTSTPQERIAATVGWVYMPMIAPPVFDGATSVADGELDFEVFDGENATTQNMIYDDSGDLATAVAGPIGTQHYADRLYHRNRQLEIGGRNWTVTMSTNDHFVTAPRTSAWTVGIGGPLLSLLLGLTVYILGSSARRARKLAVSMTADLRHFANEAHAATRAKSEFIANMSHEIRTPMTSILGYADLLRSDPEAHTSQSKRLTYIDTIKRSGNHLLSLINDILDISKIEAGKLEAERVETPASRLVHEVVSLMAVKAHGKGLELAIHFNTEIPESIHSDPFRLRQILVNLAGNAIKFTRKGGIRIELDLDREREMLACRVIDTGIGMTEEQVGRLFQSFEQADTSTTREYGGTGLGLMISGRLAEILGGRITVESKYGEGSTFTLTVPTGPLEGVKMLPAGPSQVVHQPTDVANENGDDFADTPHPLADMHILVAEDGIDNQRLIAFHLKKAGAKVTVVENGKLAVEALSVDGTLEGAVNRTAPFDLLLSDMQMPEMDGYTAVSLLRAKGCTLPIVALTAHAMAGDDQRCLDAGCNDYATKPIDRVQLIAVCMRHFGKERRRKNVA